LRHNLKPREVPKSLTEPPSDTMTSTDDTWYPIERLVGHKRVNRKDYFLVKWLDATGSRSWEPKDNITQYAIDQYFVEKKQKAKRRKKRRI